MTQEIKDYVIILMLAVGMGLFVYFALGNIISQMKRETPLQPTIVEGRGLDISTGPVIN